MGISACFDRRTSAARLAFENSAARVSGLRPALARARLRARRRGKSLGEQVDDQAACRRLLPLDAARRRACSAVTSGRKSHTSFAPAAFGSAVNERLMSSTTGPGEAEVREQERAAAAIERLESGRRRRARTADVGNGDAAQVADPGLARRQRHQRRPRRNDRVSEAGGPGIAVAGRSAAGIRLAADGDDQLAGDEFALIGREAKAAIVAPLDLLHGLGQRPARLRCAETA